MEYKIILANVQKRLSGEFHSKLLKLNTPLYDEILAYRNRLLSLGNKFDTRPPHIEVIKDNENKVLDVNETLNCRSLELEGRKILFSIKLIGKKALVIPTGFVTGYGETHITIAYFLKPLGKELFEKCEELIKNEV